jgi:ApaG protein
MNSPSNRVDINVEVIYSPGHSVANRLFYIYFIAMTNTGSQRVQLLRRHFVILDGHGNLQEVDGEGVVGEQPILEPGETYRYTSGVPVSRPPGSMEGYYTFQNADGELFTAELPRFPLNEPPGYVAPAEASLEGLTPGKTRTIN